MTIQYRKLPSGGFGNRLFQLNFVGQLSKFLDTKYRFLSLRDLPYVKNSGSWQPLLTGYFKGVVLGTDFFDRNVEEVQVDLLNLASKQKNIYIRGSFLGDYFYEYSYCDPKEIVKLRNSEKIAEPYIAMHFRGLDFEAWNRRAILNSNYYINSLEFIDQTIGTELPVKVITDDLNLKNLRLVLGHLGSRVSVESSKHHIQDFRTLINSSALVSSPSTFAIWAGILGEQKLITHSQSWVEFQSSNGDRFWQHIENGGNKFYKSTLIPG